VWWFELVDMIHKLFLTSILPFFTTSVQIPVALTVVMLYLITILLKSPYIRKTNDRFHIFSQVALFLILLSAYILWQGSDYIISGAADLLLSILLIIITIALFLLCIIEIIRSFHFFLRHYQRRKLLKLQMRIEAESRDGSTSLETPSVKNDESVQDGSGLQTTTATPI